MAYGIELQNELGETITEYSNVLFESVSDGVTKTPPNINNASEINRSYYFRSYQRGIPGAGTAQSLYQQIAKGIKWTNTGQYNPSLKYQCLIGTDEFGLYDVPFVQPGPNGIWMMLGSRFRYPSNGATNMQWAVGSHPDTGLNYKIATTELPNSRPGNYGMQIKNSSGDTVFDSRLKQISLVGHFYVSQADFRDVLDHGATKTYTIPTPSAGAYLNIMNWTSFAYTGSGSTWVPRLRQTADDTFTMTRYAISGLLPAYHPVPSFSAYFNDAAVMVAADI